MKTVDARGLSCPEPVMLTEEALKAGEFPVKILVSEPHQKSNIENFAGSLGYSVTANAVGSEFELVIKKA